MKPIIYQLLPRTFTNYNENCIPNGSIEENGCGKFNQITDKALQAIKEMGITHVWYVGILRHATAQYNNPYITKGKAGSPYAITDFYDVDIDLAENKTKRMDEFDNLIQRTHKNKLKVGIDFVPNHVSREYKSICKPSNTQDLGQTDNPNWAFSPLNNFYYIPNESFVPQFPIGDYHEYPAKATGNDCFSPHPSKNDWYETVKLNYGVFYQNNREKQFDPIPSTWTKMKDVLLFWCKKKIDFFRVDMAEMIPIEFWQWLIPQIKSAFPNVELIAECYNINNYRPLLNSGFTYIYDKVGMYDNLRDIVSKTRNASDITQCWMSMDDIKSNLLYFLENHDEQRIASGFFCGNGNNAKPAIIILATLWNNPMLIYAGQELGEKGMQMEGFSGMDGKSSIFDYTAVPSIQKWANNGLFNENNLSPEQKQLRHFYKKILSLAASSPTIANGKLYDIEYFQQHPFNVNRQFAFLRFFQNELLLIVVNFDDKQVTIPISIPQAAFDYLQMSQKNNASAIDLLTDKHYPNIPLCANAPFNLTIDAWDGLILQIKTK